MLCFKVQVNSEQQVVAGSAELSVLTAIVTFSAERQELSLELAGLISKSPSDTEHISWIERSLSPGDRLVLEVVESVVADAPTSSRRDDPKLVESERRRYYEFLKREYEGDA